MEGEDVKKLAPFRQRWNECISRGKVIARATMLSPEEGRQICALLKKLDAFQRNGLVKRNDRYLVIQVISLPTWINYP
jgi:hypothetical protein